MSAAMLNHQVPRMRLDRHHRQIIAAEFAFQERKPLGPMRVGDGAESEKAACEIDRCGMRRVKTETAGAKALQCNSLPRPSLAIDWSSLIPRAATGPGKQ